MKRVLIWLIVLVAVFGLLILAGKNRDTIDPFLDSLGINTESQWFEEAFKFILYIVIGGPILGLLSSIFALGTEASTKDIHGYTVLRLKSGVRYTMPVASVALAVLMYVGSADSEKLWARLVFHCFGLAFLAGGWTIFRARIRFDGTALFVRGPLARERRYEWADLERIENLPDGAEYRLIFRNKRSAKISHYYAGVRGLIWLANERRLGNARTP